MADFVVGADRDLPIATGSWDGDAAKASVFKWAGFDDDKPKPDMAKRAFLVYDKSAADLKGSYKLPFARVSNGRLEAVDSGLRNAASRLPQTDIPPDVRDRARAVLDAYFKRMKKSFFDLWKSAWLGA